MRILHFLGRQHLPRDPDHEPIGGVTRVALEIARAQVELGHEVWLAAIADRGWKAQWHGVRLQTFKIHSLSAGGAGPRISQLQTRLRLIWLATRCRIDVVHGHEYGRFRFLPVGTRVIHVHNNPFWSENEEDFAGEAKGFWMMACRSHAQVAVSGYVAGRLSRGFNLVNGAGCSVHNIHVVHNAVDQARFSPEKTHLARDPLRDRWGVAENDVVFLFAGAVRPDKGVIHLARAFAELSRHIPHVHLVVAGSAMSWGCATAAHLEYEHSIRQLLSAEGKEGRVHFLGDVMAADMPRIYAACDVVVLPSEVQEACPLVIIEAFASGKAVIGSRVGGIPELVSEQNGLLVERRDESGLAAAMHTIACDAELRSVLAHNARQSARHFTWSGVARRLEGIYAQARQTNGARSRHSFSWLRYQ